MITQRQILEESFWNNFAKPALNQVVQVGKEVGKALMPGTAANISNVASGFKDARQRIKRAGMSMEDIVKEAIKEAGFIPLKGEKGEIRFAKNKKGGYLTNSDKTISGVVRVNEFSVDKHGNVATGKPYHTEKDSLIFKYNTIDKSVDIVKRPYRHGEAYYSNKKNKNKNESK